MGLMDAVLLTLLNAIACMVLPRLVSLILAHLTNHTKPVKPGFHSLEFKQKITTFPYCTTYILTNNSSCKFSPHFCTQCSSRY